MIDNLNISSPSAGTLRITGVADAAEIAYLILEPQSEEPAGDTEPTGTFEITPDEPFVYDVDGLAPGEVDVYVGVETEGDDHDYDADALTYIEAVEAADDEPLELSVRLLIDDKIREAKNTGLWDRIDCLVFLHPIARTLAGRLVPLKGESPTNHGFTEDDCQPSGLFSDGAKYLNSNIKNESLGQNDIHIAFGLSENLPDISKNLIGTGAAATSGVTRVQRHAVGTNSASPRCRSTTETHREGRLTAGFLGISRSFATSFTFRGNGETTTHTAGSQSPAAGDIYVFASNDDGSPQAIVVGGCWFYSIGSSVNLGELDAWLGDFRSSIDVLRAEPIEINLILMAGQSNAEGRVTKSTDGTPNYLTDGLLDGVKMWNGSSIVNYDIATTGPTGNGSAWSNAGTSTNRWGPYHVAMKEIADEVSNVVVCQVSVGGSVLDSQASLVATRGSWSDRFESIPGGTPKLLQAFEARYSSLMNYCQANNITVNLIGMIWHQGEADAEVSGAATVYENNWTDFVAYIRGMTGVADLPIWYGTVPAASTKYDATIRSAQLSVADGDGNLHCRDNDDLTFQDGLHFDAASCITFGQWVSAQVLSHLGVE